MRTVLLALLLLAGCVRAPAPPAPVQWGCVVLATRESPDSLYLAMYTPPCAPDGVPADTLLSWRIPSAHRWCRLYAVADAATKNLSTTWTDCAEPPKRSDGP